MSDEAAPAKKTLPGTFEQSNPVQSTDSGEWLPATNVPPDHVDTEDTRPRSHLTSVLKKQPLQNAEPQQLRAISRSSSVRSRPSLFTRDGQPVEGRAFLYGAGTSGPHTELEVDESVLDRQAKAERSLSIKQRDRISKNEARNSKQLVKVIREESKVEKQVLAMAVKELSELQDMQKATLKREGHAQSVHSSSLAEYQKYEALYLEARRKCEVLQVQLHTDAQALSTLRASTRETTERMQDKTLEIEGLRQALRMDEREREAKIAQMVGKEPKISSVKKDKTTNGSHPEKPSLMRRRKKRDSAPVADKNVVAVDGDDPASRPQNNIVATDVSGGSLVEDSSDDAGSERPLVTEYINPQYNVMGKDSVPKAAGNETSAAALPVAPPPVTGTKQADIDSDSDNGPASAGRSKEVDGRGSKGWKSGHWWSRRLY